MRRRTERRWLGKARHDFATNVAVGNNKNSNNSIEALESRRLV